MFNISLFTQDLIPKEKLAKSERAQLIKEIYAIYTSPAERILRKIENWKRFCTFCRVIKKPDTIESRSLFKKGKTIITEQSLKSFCYFTSHIPTKDLYYIKSMMNDSKNRGKSGSAWLISQINMKETVEKSFDGKK